MFVFGRTETITSETLRRNLFEELTEPEVGV